EPIGVAKLGCHANSKIIDQLPADAYGATRSEFLIRQWNIVRKSRTRGRHGISRHGDVLREAHRRTAFHEPPPAAIVAILQVVARQNWNVDEAGLGVLIDVKARPFVEKGAGIVG